MAIYLDNNSTTALAPEVLSAMMPFFNQPIGNASSRHQLGRLARRAIDQATELIASCLDCQPNEIIYTSGATEANNLAVRTLVGSKPGQVWISPAEHPSTWEPVHALDQQRFPAVVMPIDESGQCQPPALPEIEAEPTDGNVKLVVCQLANSETGVITDWDRLRRLIPGSARRLIDATQAIGKMPVSSKQIDADGMSLSGHKFHGPPGIGLLLVKQGKPTQSLILGGHQQRGRRAGTHPTALIVGLARAIELACQQRSEVAIRMASQRDRLESEVCRQVPGALVQGDQSARLPGTTNISFPGTIAESFVIAADLAGLCCSAGTACASGSLELSRTLLAMGYPKERVQSAVRFSLSRYTTDAEISDAIDIIVKTAARIRQAS